MRQFTSEVEPSLDEYNPVEGLTFGLDEVTFRCEGFITVLETSELARGAADDVDADSAEGMAYIANFMRLVMGNTQYQRYRRHCTARRTPSAVQLKIMAYLNDEIEKRTEAESGRPTGEPSGSSGGQQERAGRASKVISLQRGEVTVLHEERAERKTAGHRAQGAPRSAPRRAGARAAASGG